LDKENLILSPKDIESMDIIRTGKHQVFIPMPGTKPILLSLKVLNADFTNKTMTI